MERVKKWYADGRDFWDGVALLQEVGRDVAQFAPYLSESFVPNQVRQRLENELLSCDFKVVAVSQTVVTPTPEKDLIAALKAEAKALHKRHAHAHAQLHLLDADKRLPVIVEIMETIIPELDDIYAAIKNGGVRRIKNNGSELPNSPDFKQGIAEGLKIAGQMAYLKNRIFKLESANGLIAKATSNNDKVKFEAELTQKRNELVELSKHIIT